MEPNTIIFWKRNIPNLITFSRMALVPPLILALVYQRYFPALLLLVVAGVSDALDGYLAKHYDWQSRLGTVLDPFADKVLLVSVYLALSWLDLLPVWLAIVVVGRELAMLIGLVIHYIMVQSLDLVPTRLSKVNTALQLALAVTVLVQQGLLPSLEPLIIGLVYAVLLTTVASGLDYAWGWGSRLFQVGNEELKQGKRK